MKTTLFLQFHPPPSTSPRSRAQTRLLICGYILASFYVEFGFALITGPNINSAIRHAVEQWKRQRGFFSLFTDTYRVDGELVVGKYVVGSIVWLREGEVARLVLQHRERFAVLVATYVKSDKLHVEGEACIDVEKLDEGECRRLSYRAYCRHCRSADGRRYERCWAEAETDDRQVRAALEKLGLRYTYGHYESEPLDRRKVEELVKVLKSICG